MAGKLFAAWFVAGAALAAADDPPPRREPSIKPTRNAYVVAPNGNDSNPGTKDAPWKTLKKACQTLKPGDAVYLRAGTYEEILAPQRSGEEGNYILYAAFPGETPAIDGKNVKLPEWGGPVDLKKKSWIAISGLTVRNALQSQNGTCIFAENSDHLLIEFNRTEQSIASGIGLWRCSYVVVDGNEVVHAGVGGDKGGQEAISIAVTDHFEVRNNFVHDCHREGIDTKEGSSFGKVVNNRLKSLERVALYADAWDKHTHDIEFSGNLVEDCKVGMMAGSEMGGLLENVRYVNNVFFRCRDFAGAVDDWGGNVPRHPLKSIYVINNTFWQTKGPFMLCNRDVERIVIRNNIFGSTTGASDPLWFPQAKASAPEYTVENNVHIPNAKGFVDPEAGDFRLVPGSPAIDKGSPLDAPAEDRAGNARPAGAAFDCGAYEFGASPRKKGAASKVAPKAETRPPREPVPEAVALWKERLKARLLEQVASGAGPACTVFGMRGTVAAAAPNGDLTVRLQMGGQTSLPWGKVGPAEGLSLARGLLRPDVAADHALLAFYLILNRQEEAAAAHLARAGDLAREVEAAFQARP